MLRPYDSRLTSAAPKSLPGIMSQRRTMEWVRQTPRAVTRVSLYLNLQLSEVLPIRVTPYPSPPIPPTL